MAQITEGLNAKQQRFVDEYLKDLNGKQAAIRAGYSAKTAEQGAAQLLSNIKVSAEVTRRLEASAQKAHLTVERIDQEIARIAFADLRKLYDDKGNLKPVTEWDDDIAAAVAGMEVVEEFEGRGEARERVGFLKKVKTWDKGNALTLAARRLGLLKDKTEVDVTVRLETLIMQSMNPVQEIEG